MLEQKYQNERSEILSYDFTDIVSGLGYTNFYGLTCSVSGSTTYDLVLQRAYSEIVETTRNTVGTTTCTFDSSTFNLPRYANGVAYLSVQGFSGGTTTIQLQAQVQKVASDGTTTTDISSNILSSYYTNSYPTLFLKIPMTGTQIKIGEKLRLIVGLVQISGANYTGFAHDPMNRDGETYIKPSVAGQGATSTLNFYMPFRIDN